MSFGEFFKTNYWYFIGPCCLAGCYILIYIKEKVLRQYCNPSETQLSEQTRQQQGARQHPAYLTPGHDMELYPPQVDASYSEPPPSYDQLFASSASTVISKDPPLYSSLQNSRSDPPKYSCNFNQ